MQLCTVPPWNNIWGAMGIGAFYDRKFDDQDVCYKVCARICLLCFGRFSSVDRSTGKDGSLTGTPFSVLKRNIAKGTTDPRVEFILPEGWVHLAKVPSWGRITSSTAVMWTRTGNLTNYTSKNPLQVASGPHPLRRARGLSKELVPNVQLWMKHQALPSHTRPIKFTKQEWVSELGR